MHPTRDIASDLLRRGRARYPWEHRLLFGLATCALALGASPALALEISTASFPAGTAGVAYAHSLVAANGTTPYAWSVVEGGLPAGLSLDGGTGEVSGTSNVAGTSDFVVLLQDAVGDTVSRALSITIAAAAPVTLTFEVQPSDVVAGATMSPAVQVKVTDVFGNPVESELVSLALVGTGTLSGGEAVPTGEFGIATFSGLSMNLAGSKQLTATSEALTPANSVSFTVFVGAPAALTFEVQPSDVLVGATMSPAVQVKVADAFGNPITGESVALALVGTGTLSGGGALATNGSGIATFSGLSVSLAGSKQLSATSGSLGPVSSASFNVTCPTLSLSPATLPNGATGDAYSQTITASGGTAPYAFAVTAGTLPTGLVLDPGGLLFETPSETGPFTFTVTATDANGCSGSSEYTMIVCGSVSVTPSSLPDAQQGAPYSQALAGNGGIAPYTFAVTAGTLPSGLSLSGAGLLSGTPTATGVFSFSVTATASGGCAGSTPFTLTVPAVPAPVTNLAAVRLVSGNDADGTARLQLTFTATAFASTAEVYRAPFGGYPRYDDAGGNTPPTPSYPPGAPWALTAVTASGQTDEPATRDAWSYVVFLKNSVGQASTVSNKTPSTPNYALGDVSNGITAGAGDNQVSDLDISLLGAHYGISNGAITGAGVSYLDVGPTTDLAVTSRPFTDNRIDFEDLIVFATNYGAVSSPASIIAGAEAAARAARGLERLSLRAPSLVEAGQTFDVELDLAGAGRVQGISAELAWDASVAEPVSMTSSGWVEGQGGVVLSPRLGTVDAALLGARSRGLSGTGTLARFTFVARRVGDPSLRLARALARDAANRPLGDGVFASLVEAGVPTRTLLLAPTPNPSQGDASLAFALAARGDVDLAVYSVDGRRVRTVARGVLEPGSYRFDWKGDDDARRAVAPGVYYAQLTANGKRWSRTIVHLR